MNNTNTKEKALYKVLNEQRTQGGNWRADQRSQPETSTIPFSITIPYNGYCQPIFDTAAFPPNNEANLQRMEGDALYAALAVNSFAGICEALENLVNKMESSMLTADIEYYRKEKNAAKEALNKIS